MRRAVQPIIGAIFLSLFTLPLAAQSSPRQAQAPARSEKSLSAAPGGDQDTRNDIQRMRAILNQMKTNLAFVGSTTTPLAHQFQLDIDMWQALLDQMEQRAEKSQKENPR
jgi:hypothetical protein